MSFEFRFLQILLHQFILTCGSSEFLVGNGSPVPPRLQQQETERLP